MPLSDHSRRPIDDPDGRSWDPEALRSLSLRLLADLTEARERLNHGPTNSSRPPSSRAPGDRGETVTEPDDAEGPSPGAEPIAGSASAGQPAPVASILQPTRVNADRKAGKQPGAPGAGRTQVFSAPEECPHYPAVCVGGGRALEPAGAVAYPGFQAVDLRWSDPARPGLTRWVVDPRSYEVACACGHYPRAAGGRGEGDPLLAGVERCEWRGVGPGLAGLIVALRLRFRLSRARLQEFRRQGLGVELSIGTLHPTLPEAAAALAPAEAEWVEAVLASGRLHADETSWPERGRPRWLWGLTAATVTLYSIAGRGKEWLDHVLDGFTGWLMRDGWVSYRGYPRRRRCGAHLRRKARGLAESSQRDVRAFGRPLLDARNALLADGYAARQGQPAELPTQHASLLADLPAAREQHQGPPHAKTHALAVEWLSDGAALFQGWHHPELPWTNPEAERALRHWVIARQISHGTRTATGSRVLAFLARVIDPCRQRGLAPWSYLAAARAARRAGRPRAPLPPSGE